MIYAVIDTNVLVSALLSKYPDSATVKVVELVSENGIRPLYNQEILTEYKDVLNRTKFNFPPHLVDAILNLIQEIGVKCDRVKCEDVFDDPKDIVFYEVALSKDNAHLVTGNKRHFPQNPIVVTPSEMLDILRATNMQR